MNKENVPEGGNGAVSVSALPLLDKIACTRKNIQ